MEIRVYAIPKCSNMHKISNEELIGEAEDYGTVWSLWGFQNYINKVLKGVSETVINERGIKVGTKPLGEGHKPFYEDDDDLYFRFIDVDKVDYYDKLDKL